MDVDASQYAEISREMANSNDFLHIYDRGRDYLDKPPMLFWTAALSMKAFGATPFAYKLPSILVALLAIYATYRLARLLYSENTARLSALVLATCQGFFLWTNDVRTDMMLAGFVVTGMWCMREFEVRRRWYFLVGGAFALACGMMTKGPIALLVPIFAFGIDRVLRRKWKQLFSPWHLVTLSLIAIFLIPMCIGLYQQFDMHPEKWIDGKQGTSGLKFFFWTQSFGRITGENTWNNGADPFFLLNSMSWAFLPWTLLFLAALFINLRKLVKRRFRLLHGQEFVSTGGFVLTYLALCMSRYQLPHYILVAFPLAAIMVGRLLRHMLVTKTYPRLSQIFTGVQTLISALLLLAALAIITLVFPAGRLVLLLWAAGFALWLFISLKNKKGQRLLWTSVAGIIIANVFLTHFFYYPLLRYEVGPTVGKYIHSRQIPEGHVRTYRVEDPLNALHFYARMVVPQVDETPTGNSGDYLLLMDKDLRLLDSMQRPYEVVLDGELFKVTELTPEFLNLHTRHKATKPWSLVQLH